MHADTSWLTARNNVVDRSGPITDPVILLVPGMWSGPSVWDAWSQTLADAGFSSEVIALPGHAPNEPDTALHGIGLNDYVAAVLHRVEQLATPPILIGHSLGGLVVQRVAAQTRLKAAVLINTAAPSPIFPLRLSMLPAVGRHFLPWHSWRHSFRLAQWEANYLLFNALPKEDQPTVRGDLKAESGKVMWEAAFGALNCTRTNRVDNDAITCPMLALAGCRDRIIPIAVSRRIKKFYKGKLSYREFLHHAHWMLGEPGWRDRADEVISWLTVVAESAEQPQAYSA